MKNIFKIIFFVFTIIIVGGLKIRNVSASPNYSNMECTYMGASIPEKSDGILVSTTFTLTYTESGKLKVPDTATATFLKSLSMFGSNFHDEQYKVVNVDFKENDFLSGNYLSPVCPGNNDIDYYIDENNKKFYIANTQPSLKKYLDKKGIKYSNKSLGKAKVEKQYIANYPEININGKKVASETTYDCTYASTKNQNNKIVVSFGATSGKVLYTRVLEFNDYDFPYITAINGNFSESTCPKSLSVGTNENSGVERNDSERWFLSRLLNSNESITRLYLYKEAKEVSNGSVNREIFELTDSVSPIILTETTGCALWGSVLKVLKDEIFALVKYSLIGFLIVFGMIDFSKAMFSGEEEKTKEAAKKFSKRVVAVIVIFLLPLFIETVINWILVSEGTDIETCISDF